MNAGTDLDCGTYYQNHLPAAYEQGLLNETTLDQALVRLYSSLVRTGYFDSSTGPYSNLTFSDVNTPYAQDLARKAAAEGIVLLKNDGLLPLKITNNTSIALIDTVHCMQLSNLGLRSTMYRALEDKVTRLQIHGCRSGAPRTRATSSSISGALISL